MSGKFLLDTNIVIAYLNNDPPVIQRIKEAGEILVPSIVLGELYYGAQKSGRLQQNLVRADTFAAGSTILVCDQETARYYGEIRYNVQRKGRPIPDNDIWIAALARQHNLTLVTRDAHFAEIENLDRESW